METLEQLVKLASLGTAGVCVLAVFLIGTSIFRLGNDTPEWKVSLMKKYMNTCIIIAFICTISGGANAYFNQNKIKVAEKDLVEFGDRYEEEVNQLNAYKTDLEINEKYKIVLNQLKSLNRTHITYNYQIDELGYEEEEGEIYMLEIYNNNKTTIIYERKDKYYYEYYDD